MRPPAVPGAVSRVCIRPIWMRGSRMRLPASVSRVRPVLWKRGGTGGGLRNWSGNCIARTRHWPKRLPCWCCQKSSQRSSTTARTHDPPGRPPDSLIDQIAQARVQGARLAPACALAGIDVRTLKRWQSDDGVTRGDRRPDADRPVPSHALSETERAQIIAVANEPRFAETPPARIVPALADEGIYIASESSFHRVLRAQ